MSYKNEIMDAAERDFRAKGYEPLLLAMAIQSVKTAADPIAAMRLHLKDAQADVPETWLQLAIKHARRVVSYDNATRSSTTPSATGSTSPVLHPEG